MSLKLHKAKTKMKLDNTKLIRNMIPIQSQIFKQEVHINLGRDGLLPILGLKHRNSNNDPERLSQIV